MTTRLISTTTEPVTLAEVKTLVPIDGTDHDARINVLIPVMRQQAEQITRRSLAANTYQMKLDEFPDVIELTWAPTVSVTSITYIDTAGATQTISDAVIDLHSEPARITPAVQWPEIKEDMPNAISIAYTAGYGTTAPKEVKMWIAAMIGIEIDGREVPPYLDGLLDRLRVY